MNLILKMKTRLRTAIADRASRLAGVVAVVPMLVYAASASALPVEDMYKVAGPAVVIQSAGMDAANKTYTIYYPANMATDGYANPLITWGNGSGQTCTTAANSQAIGRHLASWGFVFVCANTTTSGWGTEVWDGARHMIAENSRNGSVFFGQIDTSAIGSVGHSQGATGALNANVLAAGQIKSTFTLAFVDKFWHNPQSQFPNISAISGRVFLSSGCNDWLSSQQVSNYNSFNVPKAMACVKNASHDPMIMPSIRYATAWFMYTLRGDTFARGAFVGTNGIGPELSQNTAWSAWASSNLP